MSTISKPSYMTPRHPSKPHSCWNCLWKLFVCSFKRALQWRPYLITTHVCQYLYYTHQCHERVVLSFMEFFSTICRKKDRVCTHSWQMHTWSGRKGKIWRSEQFVLRTGSWWAHHHDSLVLLEMIICKMGSYHCTVTLVTAARQHSTWLLQNKAVVLLGIRDVHRCTTWIILYITRYDVIHTEKRRVCGVRGVGCVIRIADGWRLRCVCVCVCVSELLPGSCLLCWVLCFSSASVWLCSGISRWLLW